VASVDTQTALLLLSDAVVSGPRLLKKTQFTMRDRHPFDLGVGIL